MTSHSESAVIGDEGRARQCHFCDRAAQPEHSPCCSSTFHGKSLCCECYCRSHFVEVNKCSPESHAHVRAVGGREARDDRA